MTPQRVHSILNLAPLGNLAGKRTSRKSHCGAGGPGFGPQCTDLAAAGEETQGVIREAFPEDCGGEDRIAGSMTFILLTHLPPLRASSILLQGSWQTSMSLGECPHLAEKACHRLEDKATMMQNFPNTLTCGSVTLVTKSFFLSASRLPFACSCDVRGAYCSQKNDMLGTHCP